MGTQTKFQAYPYSLRTVAASDFILCRWRNIMYITPPDNALTIENLHCHIVFQFDASISASEQKIERIGVTEGYNTNIDDYDDYARYFDVNLEADANRRIDYSIDLTPLLKKTNVGYREPGPAGVPNDSGTGFTMVDIIMPDTINAGNTGTMELWKLDGLFTTTGIR